MTVAGLVTHRFGPTVHAAARDAAAHPRHRPQCPQNFSEQSHELGSVRGNTPTLIAAITSATTRTAQDCCAGEIVAVTNSTFGTFVLHSDTEATRSIPSAQA